MPAAMACYPGRRPAWNRQTILDRLLIQLESGILIRLVADFIDWILSAGAFVQAVGAVEDQAGLGADVFVGVHDTGRHDQSHGIIGAHDFHLACEIGLGLWSIVPKIHLEIRRPKKAEAIRLISMFVRPASYARLGHGDVRHGRVEPRRKLVVTEQLAQPAASVLVFPQRFPNDAVDRTLVKLHSSVLLTPRFLTV